MTDVGMMRVNSTRVSHTRDEETNMEGLSEAAKALINDVEDNDVAHDLEEGRQMDKETYEEYVSEALADLTVELERYVREKFGG
jgi:hypothetical protein